MFVGNSLWQLIRQTDGISKTVLLILLIMSIICWTVFLCKAILLYLKKRDLTLLFDQAKRAKTLDELDAVSSRYAGTLPGYFLTHNLAYIREVLEERTQRKLVDNDNDITRINYYIEQSIDQLVVDSEHYLSVLSTSAAVAPLLGLFGTVWGLIHAFISISEAQMADISTIAPGIAEALTTTLVGLLVAIPALVMMNYLMAQVRYIENQLIRLGNYIGRICETDINKIGNICVDLPVTGEKELQQ